MALYLTEILTSTGDRAAAEELVERLVPAASGAGGRLLEVQVSEDFARIFSWPRTSTRPGSPPASRSSV